MGALTTVVAIFLALWVLGVTFSSSVGGFFQFLLSINNVLPNNGLAFVIIGVFVGFLALHYVH